MPVIDEDDYFTVVNDFFRRNVASIRSFTPQNVSVERSESRVGRVARTQPQRRSTNFDPPQQDVKYNPVGITSLDPDHGPSQDVGDGLVDVHGIGFRPGTTIKFGGVDEEVISVNDDLTIITVKLHLPKTPGDVDVVATNPDGQMFTLPNGFHYDDPPRIDAIFPNAGDIAGGTAVVLRGEFFDPDVIVKFGGNQAKTIVEYNNGINVSCKTPAGDATGLVDVTATNPDGQDNVFEDGFEYTSGGGGGTVYMFINPQDITGSMNTDLTIHACKSFDYNNVDTTYNQTPTITSNFGTGSTNIAALATFPVLGSGVTFVNGVATIVAEAILSNPAIGGSFQLFFSSTGGYTIVNFGTSIGVF